MWIERTELSPLVHILHSAVNIVEREEEEEEGEK
jgi:hypothetical protein